MYIYIYIHMCLYIYIYIHGARRQAPPQALRDRTCHILPPLLGKSSALFCQLGKGDVCFAELAERVECGSSMDPESVDMYMYTCIYIYTYIHMYTCIPVECGLPRFEAPLRAATASRTPPIILVIMVYS